MTIEAMKQVLTRLEGMNHEDSIFAGEFDKEIKLLSQAIAEAEKQEPVQHWSDCAVHSEPAYPKGECDCGGYTPATPATEEDLKVYQSIADNYYKDAQSKQEPVAEVKRNSSGQIYIEWRDGEFAIANLVDAKLYTHLQPKREWVELTPKQYDEIYASNKNSIYEAMMVVATYLKRENT